MGLDPPDQELVDLIRHVAEHDEAAMSALYDRMAGQVFGLALRILRDRGAAEEATLDVFMQVWRQAAAYDPSRGGPSTWLLTLARCRALDRRRALESRRSPERPLECALQSEAGGESPETSTGCGERRESVRRALARVSAEEREVLGFAFFLGLTHSEIAARLSQPLGTVKTRIRNGMIKLRNFLQPLETGS